MDRIKRLSNEVLVEHKSKFGEDFADNKKALNQISIIRSKGLKNEIAGYITKFIKKEIREEKAKQDRIFASQSEEEIVEAEIPETTEETLDTPAVTEEVSSETVVETSPVEETTDSSEEKSE